MAQAAGKLNGWAKVLAGFAVSLLIFAAGYGRMQGKVEAGCEAVKKLDEEKLDKPVYDQHCAQQRATDERIERQLTRIEEKLDRTLDGK